MRSIDAVIFDLDGTLVDSRRDIATSVNITLFRLGRPCLPKETIFGFIGHGIRPLLSRALSDPGDGELEEAHDLYLPLYRQHLLDTTRPYPGVREALRSLAVLPSLAVLSNKPRAESVAVLEGLGLAHHFRYIFGGDSFAQRKPRPAGVHWLLQRCGAPPERTLLVGDSLVDWETARNAGVPFCLVTYGLGSRDVARRDPGHVIDDMRQLIPIVLPEE